jgi:SOS-response transcriptional repressor LexA
MKDKTGVRLEPANRNYKTIRPKNSIEIAGIVRTVIRKYA